MTTASIYLDYNATTPVDPMALEAMLPWFSEEFGNAASIHAHGRRALVAVEAARDKVSGLVGAVPAEIVWTSGATEANNLALKGAFAAARGRTRVLVGATEHKAVLDTAEWLATSGAIVEVLPVSSSGILDVDAYAAALDERVAIVSVMVANNETGVVVDVATLAELAHQHGALFHTDATQAAGRHVVDVGAWNVDLASFSAHKVYGPKGVGALYVARGCPIEAVMHGGGHERGLRSGTLNVPGVVGFGVAAQLAASRMEEDQAANAARVEQLVSGLLDLVGGVEVVGGPSLRLTNTANLRFVGADAEAVMANAPGVAMSSGSACTSMVPSASHVLRAMGYSEQAALECLRFSVGRPTTAEQIDNAVTQVAAAVRRVRELNG